MEKIKRKCNFCGKSYFAIKSRLKVNKNLYCSKKCGNNAKHNRKRIKSVICCICKKEFIRNFSQIKSINQFCSIKCKANGMILGLTKPMRLGTGCNDKNMIKLKYKLYKYRVFDKKYYHDSIINLTLKQFIRKFKGAKCIYCGSKDNLGFDRKNNSKGHTKNNVIICCNECNMTRGNRFTVKEMMEIGKIIKQIHENRNK